MTPPLAPKIAPAREDRPSGSSKCSGLICNRSMPNDLIIQDASLVVMTMSVAERPSTSSSGLAASYFFAVQHITATLNIFLGSALILSAKYVLTSALIMDIGDLQVETFSIRSEWNCSRHFIHALEHDVIMGSLPLPWNLSKNSEASSMTVRSAE